ncbi:winged helix-turn-helix domain-containing protein [Chloroflexota bacterium]
MVRLLMIGRESQALAELRSELVQNGFACSIISDSEIVAEQIVAESPDMVMVEIDSNLSDSGTWELIQKIKQERYLEVMALVSGSVLDNIDGHLNTVDDFIISPYDTKELVLRTKRLINRTKIMDSSELIKCDCLVIDLARCEVTVEGKIVELTFKEYDLLKFLASNRGRVYTRDMLLDKVWGYDYYGGDRTVDVHIRRLRSKINDSKHTFIETVRNIGYRFIKDG